MSPHLVTDADDGSRIEVRVGDALEVRLPDNATTGYRWVLADLPAGVLEVEDESYVSRRGVGSGGTAAWTLRVVGEGRATLTAKRWRPWEGEASVIERFTLTLVSGTS